MLPSVMGELLPSVHQLHTFTMLYPLNPLDYLSVPLTCPAAFRLPANSQPRPHAEAAFLLFKIKEANEHAATTDLSLHWLVFKAQFIY